MDFVTLITANKSTYIHWCEFSIAELVNYAAARLLLLEQTKISARFVVKLNKGVSLTTGVFNLFFACPNL